MNLSTPWGSETAPARLEVAGGVLRLTLCRPRHRNPLDAATFALVAQAAERALADDVRVVVVGGEGEHFCSGLDRRLLVDLAAGGLETDDAVAMQQALLALEECPRPTIAVVRGACVGGGVELALACDFRLASTTAWFALMEMRYAFLPDLGGLHRLQREVGLARAKEMVYFGDAVAATTLERWGVVNEVVDDDDLQACAGRWIDRCLAAAPLAVSAAKRLLHADPGGADARRSLAAALGENQERLLGSEDFREGLSAALERRPPRFTGR